MDRSVHMGMSQIMMWLMIGLAVVAALAFLAFHLKVGGKFIEEHPSATSDPFNGAEYGDSMKDAPDLESDPVDVERRATIAGQRM